MPRATTILRLIPSEYHYARRVVVGLGRYAREQAGWAVVPLDPSRTGPEQLAELVDKHQAAGVVAFSANAKIDQAVADLDVPAVNVSARLTDSSLVRVIPDNFHVGRLAGEHLIAQGLRNLAYAGLREVYYSYCRRDGFLAAAREAGLPCDVHEPQNGRNLSRWLERLEKPVGIMGCNDLLASDITSMAIDMGLDVPGQVPVIGADDSEIHVETARVLLSSVPTEGDRVGYEAGAVLSGIIAGGKRPDQPVLIKPTHVSVRASTQFVPIDDPQLAEAIRHLRRRACEANVDKIIRETGVARRTFYRAVQSALGRTPHEEIRRIQMERGRELLSQSTLSVAEIAQRCGFSRSNYFAETFGKHHGQTPTEFRQGL
ncbi:MAG: substrate-binding domain-containing protein [Planctomycetota bacterium]